MTIMLEEDNFEDFELEAYELEEKLNRYKDALAYIKENVEHLQEHELDETRYYCVDDIWNIIDKAVEYNYIDELEE